ncbi:MAG: hypothetical protein H6617_10890 [Bdellovibrionaceae bacterium]|nr:hypothetical protein [Pseudobdellovibrionaceae bacterium]
MVYRLRKFVWVLLVLSLPLFAAEVLKLGKKGKFAVISHGENVPWEVEDNICFYRGAVEIACGRVVRANSKAAVMKIVTQREAPKVGDEVRRSSPSTWQSMQDERKKDGGTTNAVAEEGSGEAERKPVKGLRRSRGRNRFARADDPKKRPERRRRPKKGTSKRDIALMNENNETKAYLYDQLVKQKTYDTIYTADLTVGGSIGLNHFYPILSFQFAVGKRIALGLTPFYFAQSQDVVSISGLGGHFTFNYYHDYAYRGLWLQAGAGAIKFNASVPGSEESQTCLSFIGTVGWRQRWDLGINVGASAGVQFIVNQNLQLVDLSYRNLQPTVLIDFGLNF